MKMSKKVLVKTKIPELNTMFKSIKDTTVAENLKFIAERVPAVIATVQELVDLNIGYTEESMKAAGLYLDEYQPWPTVELIKYISSITVGVDDDEEMMYPVDKSDCVVNVVIQINGKYYKLNANEWTRAIALTGKLKIADQFPIYRRLLYQKQLTLQDLAAADIDNNLYLQLCKSEETPDEMWTVRMNTLQKWVERQFTDKKIRRMFGSLFKEKGWE